MTRTYCDHCGHAMGEGEGYRLSLTEERIIETGIGLGAVICKRCGELMAGWMFEGQVMILARDNAYPTLDRPIDTGAK